LEDTVAIPITLKVYKGDALVATKDFERDIIKIGRLASAHLSLDDEKVSRIHAVIDANDDRVSITDMGSMEGTYVNGKRVNKTTLQWGDEVKLGSTRLIVERRAANSTQPLSGITGGMPAVVPSGLQMVAAAPTPPPAVLSAVPKVQVSADAFAAAPAPVLDAVPPPPAYEPPVVAAPPQPKAVRAVPQPPAGATALKPGRPRNETTSAEVGLQVRFTWGDQLLSVFQFDKPTSFKIGSTAAAKFHLDTAKLGAEEFELVKSSGSDFVIRLPSKATGEVDDSRGPIPLNECNRLNNDGGGYAMTMTTRDFVWAELGGGVRVEFTFAPMPKKVFVPMHERMDFQFVNLLLLVFFIVGGFVITAKNMDLSDDSLGDDLNSHKAVVAKFMLKEEEKKKNPFLEKLASEKKNQGEAAAKAAKAEGKMGKKDMKQDTKQRSAQKAIDPNAKDRAKSMVSQLFAGRNGGITTIFGKGGLGGDLKSATGNLMGNVTGDSGGLGGMGLRGSETGGGGQGNTVGIGAIGTHGRGGGNGAYGNGVGDIGKKAETGISIDSDGANVQGSIDKELIRQVIHRNRQQIRYCYETQLTRFPKLEGKVAVSFVIGPEGTVQQARTASSTVGNPELESCLVARFKSWQFPKPKGGGIAQVTYPVVLTQSGAK
jgi:TonB family protein